MDGCAVPHCIQCIHSLYPVSGQFLGHQFSEQDSYSQITHPVSSDFEWVWADCCHDLCHRRFFTCNFCFSTSPKDLLAYFSACVKIALSQWPPSTQTTVLGIVVVFLDSILSYLGHSVVCNNCCFCQGKKQPLREMIQNNGIRRSCDAASISRLCLNIILSPLSLSETL